MTRSDCVRALMIEDFPTFGPADDGQLQRLVRRGSFGWRLVWIIRRRHRGGRIDQGQELHGL